MIWRSYFDLFILLFAKKCQVLWKKEKKNYSSLKNIFLQKKTCNKPFENSSSKWLQTRVWKISLAQSTSCKISLLWLDKILAWNCPRSLWLEVRVLENQVFWKASLESEFLNHDSKWCDLCFYFDTYSFRTGFFSLYLHLVTSIYFTCHLVNLHST